MTMQNTLEYTQICGFNSPQFCLEEAIGKNAVKTTEIKSVLLAYSGGADSSLLLFLLNDYCKKNGIELCCAHVNHGIRGDEALRDRDFCLENCKKLSIRCFVLDTDIPLRAKETGKSLETAAREVRYEFFDKIMKENDIKILATAHNADDNLETLLFRLTRGTGLSGLCGIPMARRFSCGFVVRPILNIEKSEILSLCESYKIPYITDSTNTDISYSRNRIRSLVIPELKKINPALCLSASRLCVLLGQDNAFLLSETEKIIQSKGQDVNSVSFLSSLPCALRMRVISQLYFEKAESDVQLEYTHLSALSRLVCLGEAHKKISLPLKITALIEEGKLEFVRDEDIENITKAGSKDTFYKKTPLSGETRLPGDWIFTLNTDTSPQIQEENENIYKLFTQVSIDSDKIIGSLFIRARLAGDKIRVGGMSRDVRKLFSEAKLPLKERETYPIICDDAGILWIPNIALRDGIISKDTNKFLKLTLKKLKEGII